MGVCICVNRGLRTELLSGGQSKASVYMRLGLFGLTCDTLCHWQHSAGSRPSWNEGHSRLYIILLQGNIDASDVVHVEMGAAPHL